MQASYINRLTLKTEDVFLIFPHSFYFICKVLMNEVEKVEYHWEMNSQILAKFLANILIFSESYFSNLLSVNEKVFLKFKNNLKNTIK